MNAANKPFRVVSEEGNLALVGIEGKLMTPTPIRHLRYSVLYGCCRDFFVGVAAEV